MKKNEVKTISINVRAANFGIRLMQRRDESIIGAH